MWKMETDILLRDYAKSFDCIVSFIDILYRCSLFFFLGISRYNNWIHFLTLYKQYLDQRNMFNSFLILRFEGKEYQTAKERIRDEILHRTEIEFLEFIAILCNHIFECKYSLNDYFILRTIYKVCHFKT